MKNNNNYDTDATRAAYIAYVLATMDVLLKPETAIVSELMDAQGLSEQEMFECIHEDVLDRYEAMLRHSDVESIFDKYFGRIRTLVAAYVRHEGVEFSELLPNWDPADPMATKTHNKIQLLRLGFDAQLRQIELA